MLRVFDPVGMSLTRVVGGGGSSSGPGVSVDLGNGDLRGVTSDGRYLYLASFSRSVVFRIDPDASYDTQPWLGATLDRRDVDGTLATGRLIHPWALYYGYGALWLGSDYNLRVVR